MMLVGSTYIHITDFKHSTKNRKKSNITLILSSIDAATKVHEKLVNFGNKSLVLTLTKFDFFSEHNSFKTRAIIGFSWDLIVAKVNANRLDYRL